MAQRTSIGNIRLKDVYMDEDYICNFEVMGNNELIKKADEIRRTLGYTDMVLNSEVYYNFYLTVDTQNSKMGLSFFCNNGVEDDWEEYKVYLTEADKLNILYSVAKYFTINY